jgi:hypothetical protein
VHVMGKRVLVVAVFSVFFVTSAFADVVTTNGPQASVNLGTVASRRRPRLPRRPRPTARRPLHRSSLGVPTPTPTEPPMLTTTPTSTPTPTATPPRLQVHPQRGVVMVLPPGHEGCGGVRGKLCSPGEFCEFGENRCGLAMDIGICRTMNRLCGPEEAPVCGCDGATYRNDCERQRAGVPLAHQGPC